MRAVHAFGTYLHTTENWCYRLIKYLPDTDIDIVCDELINLDTFPLERARYYRVPAIKYHPTHPWPVRKAYGAVRRTVNLVNRLWLNSRVKGADLMHAHFSVMGWKYLPLALNTGVPLVISFYGYDYERLPKREPIWLDHYNVLFDKAALFVAEGEVGGGKLVEMGCPADKVKVAHLGVEPDRIPVHKRTKKPGELSLVQIATITGKKGHETTVRAFIEAVKDCPDMTLTLVGRDTEGLKAGLVKLIEEAGVRDKVEFLDGIDFTKLHDYLSGFQAFIHPSRHSETGDSEGGAPIVLLDAQATGMPVLSTTHCDIPGEVLDGRTGLLVPENDWSALAGSIARLYAMDDDEYQSFCRNARRHIEDNFNAVKCGAHLKRLYDELVEKRR